MILSPEVLTLLILDTLFLVFGIIAFLLSIKIFMQWDINATTSQQYQLEKQSFLTATIVKYIFAIKLPLFLFFIFTLDNISSQLTGAMCAAGVVDATDYGLYLLILKIVNLYLFAIWLTLHALDMRHPNLPYTRLKFEFFIIAFLFLIAEIIVEVMMFSDIDIDKMVSCCGTLYSTASTSSMGEILTVPPLTLLTLFYGSFSLLVVAFFLRIKYLFALSNILYLIVALISLIALFGTYIYELPTHHCPFCFLQGDYYYIGYVLYSFLFIGTFYGIRSGLTEMLGEDSRSNYRVALIFNTLYLLLVTLYPLLYFIRNGVWL